MWPFSKQARALNLPPEDEQSWGVAQGEYHGHPVVVRFNKSAGDWAGHVALPVKLGFATLLKRPNAQGLPDPAENAELLEVEDVIVQRVLSSATGVHALTLTTGVMKEWVFYVGSDIDVAPLHQVVQRVVPTHDIQCMAVEDKQWTAFRAFAP